MLQKLSRPTFQVRRRLQTLFKIINNESPLTIPSYYLHMERATRHYHRNATPSSLHPLIYISRVLL